MLGQGVGCVGGKGIGGEMASGRLPTLEELLGPDSGARVSESDDGRQALDAHYYRLLEIHRTIRMLRLSGSAGVAVMREDAW